MSSGLKDCRVLIVEDEYFLADDLKKALEAQGATVVGPIADFEEACDQVKHDGFDVAVLDINLRNQAAYPLADELMRQEIPFIFYTGYDAQIIPQRFANVTIWQKPFDPSDLIEQIGGLCQRGSASA